MSLRELTCPKCFSRQSATLAKSGQYVVNCAWHGIQDSLEGLDGGMEKLLRREAPALGGHLVCPQCGLTCLRVTLGAAGYEYHCPSHGRIGGAVNFPASFLRA